MSDHTVPLAAPDVSQLRRVHLIGIGGAGMSGIARILLTRGCEVSGSDARDSRAVLALRALGARIAVGHAPENLDQLSGPPTVVVSSAIKDSNPELTAARAGGLVVLHRSQALAALMTGSTAACVAGTHGKTSTTSMLTVALQHCGMDPSFAIGGDLTEAGSGAHHGGGDVFVAEADESDGSFLAFTPTVAIVTNVEPDHLDHHGTAEAYVAVFDEFTRRIAPGGVLVACADDEGAAALADRAEAAGVHVLRYGADGPDARILSYAADAHGGVCEVELAPRVRAAEGAANAPQRVQLRIAAPGEHMARNAVAALVAGRVLGGEVACLLDGLASFQGVRRRFEFKGNAAGVRVYDDYAHHPTEVEATLRAARPVAAGGRVLAAFQPHLYSRTRIFAAEFGRALALADEIVVLDVYGAREEPEPGVNGALVVQAIRDAAPDAAARHEPQWSHVPELLAGLARPGDIVVLMGAGDITVLAAELVNELDRRAAGGSASPTAPA